MIMCITERLHFCQE